MPKPIAALAVLTLATLLHLPAAAGAGAAAAATRAAMDQRRTPVVKVFQACKEAVVNISSTSVVEVRSPWDAFFDAPPQRYRQTSVGSGFVIHPAGYIVTNAHVVARTAERKVIFPDKREWPAQVVAIDHEHDLAVLKIDADKPLTPLRLGRSDDLMVGETVVAIGNPLGYQHTCTAGVISATERTLTVDQDVSFEGLIQTDASINPGNSGGPLLNVLGELIGVNTAIRGDAQNIGFAIPVDQLRNVLPEMLDVERRYRIVTGLKLEADGAARIAAVEPDSPAARAGLAPGQVVAAVDDQPVANSIDFHIALLGHKGGDTLRLRLAAGSAGGARLPVEAELVLGTRPRPDADKLLAERFGVEAQALDAKMARAMGMEGLSGLLVNKVEPGSPADRIGLRRGDVITLIGRHPSGEMSVVGDLLEQTRPGQVTTLTVLRLRGTTVFRSTVRLKLR